MKKKYSFYIIHVMHSKYQIHLNPSSFMIQLFTLSYTVAVLKVVSFFGSTLSIII